MLNEDINQHIYKQIKQQQLKLTPEEQWEICVKIDTVLKQIAYKSWMNPLTRELLKLEHNRRRTIMADPVGYANVSKMGRDFNSSKPGYNRTVRQRINQTFKEARIWSEAGKITKAASIFKEINLHPSFLMTNDQIPILDKHNHRTLEYISYLNELREMLVCSVMKAASELAHIRFRPLQGEVLDFADLIQEARLSIWEGTLIFDVHRASVKWSTFAWKRMFNVLGKYVAENSRTVALPRTLLDQYGPIQEAIEQVGLSDYSEVALKANEINAKRKHRSSGRKLTPKEIYTPEQIERFLRHVNEWMSLDITVNENADESREVALVDTLSRDVGMLERESEREMIGRSLRRLLKRHLGVVEYPLLILKWGLDENYPRQLEYSEVLAIWKENNPGKKMHRVRIKEIEQAALARLKEHQPPDLKDLWEAFNLLKTKGE